MQSIIFVAFLVAIAVAVTLPKPEIEADIVNSLEPYTRESLAFTGAQINDVKIDDLVTYFDYFFINISSNPFYSTEKFNNLPYSYRVRQARLNHKAFSVNIEIKSDVAAEAILKIFMAPKYACNGDPITLEDNRMTFVELDFFRNQLNQGMNAIVRNSEDFFYSTDVRNSMSILPKGTQTGIPYQFFLIIYPDDNKPFRYPLDRPVDQRNFNQPNMFFKDVLIKHEGD